MSFLQSPHLFTHVYDIDTLIAAFCTPDENQPSGENPAQWTLDTRSGTLTAPHLPLTDTPQAHRFLFSPLPQTFPGTLFTTHAFTRQPEDNQAAIRDFIQQYPTLATAYPEFNNSYAGGWLRERVKEAILDWLDTNDLIPPSMRHANPQAIFGAPPPPPKKVRIS